MKSSTSLLPTSLLVHTRVGGSVAASQLNEVNLLVPHVVLFNVILEKGLVIFVKNEKNYCAI